MKLTAFSVLLFFVCLNVSLYLINETAILPHWEQSPYEEPEGIAGKLISVDLSTGNLMIAGTALIVSIIVGWLTGHLIFGGTVGIIMFGFSILFPVISWVVLGLPRFLAQMQVPTPIYTAITALLAVVWFWFLMGFIAQRPLED